MTESVQKAGIADDLILEGLLVSPTIRAAASYAEVSPSTVYSRLRDPVFMERYRELQAQRVEALAGAVDRLAQLSLLELEKIITAAGTSDRDRISACKAVLSTASQRLG